VRAVRAICIKCGADKRRAVTTCTQCKFRPTSDLDLAKSVSLSIEQFVTPEEPDAAWDMRMREAQRQLQAGQPVEYDERQLQDLIDNKKLIARIPLSAPLGAVFRLWIPIFVMIGFIIFMRWLRGH
jgi:hypothetical protein